MDSIIFVYENDFKYLQILSTPVLSKSALSANLIRDYTGFVKEVKLNISEWAEARSCIHNIK